MALSAALTFSNIIANGGLMAWQNFQTVPMRYIFVRLWNTYKLRHSQ